jgi:hypothetical protein
MRNSRRRLAFRFDWALPKRFSSAVNPGEALPGAESLTRILSERSNESPGSKESG